MSAVLSLPESKRLVELEEVIERGVATFIQVGEALAEIRDSQLYRIEYKTFEDYCCEEWEMSRPRVYQLIGASKAAANLSTFVDKPKNESQARPLTKLESPKDQQEAWQEAVEESGGKPTAKHVEAAVARRLEPQSQPTISAQIEQVRTSNGITLAEQAIQTLKRIKHNDTERKAAGRLVKNWINKNLQ